jgi:AcrR family transcriptional regulator
LGTGDALHGPKVGGRRTYVFAFIDDHSRAIVGHRLGFAEDTVRCATGCGCGEVCVVGADRCAARTSTGVAEAERPSISQRVVPYGYSMTLPSAPRGRPRDTRAHQAILTATTELVTEVGYADTSIGAVAARAGVGKDTVYRRWSGKAELVYEAVFTEAEAVPAPDTGTLAGDLTALLEALIQEFSAPAAAAALPGLLADFAADPALQARIRSQFLAPAKACLVAVFERAVRRGEADQDVPVDLVLDTLAGAVFFHVGLVGARPSLRLATQLAAIVGRGIETR